MFFNVTVDKIVKPVLVAIARLEKLIVAKQEEQDRLRAEWSATNEERAKAERIVTKLRNIID
jgi:hypothetical protein